MRVLHVIGEHRLHPAPELRAQDDRVDLVVPDGAAPIEVGRPDRRPLAVDHRGLGVQDAALAFVDAAVIVQVEEQDTSLVRAMLEVCTKGLSGGECSSDKTAQAAAYATVEWQDDQKLLARVHVEWRGSKTALGDTVRFTAGDAIVERYRAVGLVIATLAGEVKHIAEAPPPSPLPSHVLSLDVGAVVGGPELWRLGGMARVMIAPMRSWFVEIDQRVAVAPRAGGLLGRSASTTVGGGAGADVGWVWLAARIDAGAEILYAETNAGGYQSESIWVGLLRAGVEVAAPARRWLGVFLGVDGGVHTPVPVHVQGREVAGFPAFEVTFTLGARLSPF